MVIYCINHYFLTITAHYQSVFFCCGVYSTIIELMEGEQAQTISIERGKYSYPHRMQGSALGQKLPPMYYKSTTDCSTPRSILSLLNRGMVGLNNLYRPTAVISSGTKTMKININQFNIIVNSQFS